MSLTLMISKTIANKVAPSQRKAVIKTVQYGIYGFLVAFAGYILSVLSYSQKYQLSMEIIFARDESGFFMLSPFIICAAGLSYYHMNKKGIEIYELIYEFQKSVDKKLPFVERMKFYILSILSNRTFSIIFFTLFFLLIVKFSFNAVLLLPKNIQNLFDPTDTKLFLNIILIASFLFSFGILHTIYTKSHKSISDSIVFLFFYLIPAIIMATYRVYDILFPLYEDFAFSLSMSAFFPLLLCYLFISTRNPQNKSDQQLKSDKSEYLAILLSLTFSVLITIILDYSRILQQTPILLLQTSDKDFTPQKQILLIDRISHFVAYDPVKKHSKVYEKSRYEWEPTEVSNTSEPDVDRK